MTDRQIFIVKDSWHFVIMNGQEAGDVFYKKLFEINPALRALFKYDQAVQSRKFMAMLAVFVSKAHCIDTFAKEMSELGKRHARYGTQPMDYITAQKALLSMLESILKSRWDVETKEAWETAFQVLALKMIEANEFRP